jgi:putative PEP-CTERM system TPR-repeat lipoprotein
MTNVYQRTTRIAVLAAMLVAMTGCGLFMSPERRIARAENFIEQGDYGSAAIELRQALESAPDNRQARLMLAKVAHHTGDYSAARKELGRAIELGAAPQDTAALQAELQLVFNEWADLAQAMAGPVAGLGEAERQMYAAYAALGLGDLAQAQSASAAALAAKPSAETAARVRTLQAEAYAGAGDTAQAMAVLDEVLAADPRSAQASIQKAGLQVQAGQPAAAEKTLLAVAGESVKSLPLPQRIAIYASLAEIQLTQSRLDDAAASLQKLQEHAPNSLAGPILKAQLALARNDAATAVTELQRVVAAAPEFSHGRVMLAQALLANGNVAQAESELNAAIESDPDNIEARKLLAETQIRAGRSAAAVDTLMPAVNANTSDPEVYSLFGRAKFQEGNADAAKDSWEQGIEFAEGDTQAQLALAASYIAAGDSQRALQLLATLPDDAGDSRKGQLQLVAMATGKDPKLAQEEIAALVRKNPKDVPLLTLAASWSISQQQFDQAGQYLDDALKAKPDDVSALAMQARLQTAQRKTAAAQATFERILKVDPTNRTAFVGLAQQAESAGDAAGAARWIEQWRKADPKAAEPRLLLARRAFATSDAEAGNKLLAEALATAPKDARVVNAAGQVLLEAGRNDEALTRLQEAVALSPDSPEYLLNVARTQVALNQPQAARESLGKALALRSNWLPAVGMLAELDLVDGRIDAALEAAARLKKSPASAAAGFMLEGEIRGRQKEYVAADKAFGEAFRLAPTANAAVRQSQVRRLGGIGQPDQPLRAWLERQPNDASMRFALGEYLQTRGDLKGAAAEYEKAAAAAPQNAVVLNNLAWVYNLLSDERALPTASRDYKAAPQNWAIADTYGWILVQTGDIKQGLTVLRQVSEKYGNNPEVLYHLGIAELRAGNTAAGRSALEKALASPGDAPWKQDARKALTTAK